MEENKNVLGGEETEETNPEWKTCLIGRLSFCPKCGKEALLCDGIKEVCTACNYQKKIK